MNASSAAAVVLVVEDDPAIAKLVAAQLEHASTGTFTVEHRGRLGEALTRLAQGGISAVVLDLGLPDATGAESVPLLQRLEPEVPIVVLTGSDDDSLAQAALAAGAQDYVVKGSVTGDALARAVRNAIARHRMVDEVRDLALVDELTGLRNRRGLMVLAEHEIAAAERSGTGFTVLFIDVDNMKAINDRYGHAEGDRALCAVADAMRGAARDSDVLARLGGDEFCALLPNCVSEADVTTVLNRLQDEIARHNRRERKAYTLSVSVGTTRYDAARPVALHALLARADDAMYEAKRANAMPRTVLVVDPDETIRATLADMLGQEFDVQIAATGQEALRRCSEQPPHIVLLDLDLVDADGIEMARRLRTLPETSDVPIILMSSTNTLSTERESLRSGVSDFVTKPFDLEVLRHRIDNLLRRAPR